MFSSQSKQRQRNLDPNSYQPYTQPKQFSSISGPVNDPASSYSILNKQKNLNSEEKFFHHFQSINNTTNYINSKFNTDSKNKSFEKIFMEKMQGYQTLEPTSKNATSIIDKIINTVESSSLKQGRVHQAHKNDLRFVVKPTIIPLQGKIRERVLKINDFFTHIKRIEANQKEQEIPQRGMYATYKSQISHDKLDIQDKLEQFHMYDLEQYSKALKIVPLPKSKNQHQRGISSSSRQKQVEINTEPLNPNSANSTGTLRKIDILLIQILREKKRKGLVDDYFKVMEMKLIELLDYILEDEPEYHDQNIILADKMKEILRNLEQFKGKYIEGQPKVNLLRIFFQEFRNLKQERQKKAHYQKTYSIIHQKQRSIAHESASKQKHQEKVFFPSQNNSHHEKELSDNINPQAQRSQKGQISQMSSKKKQSQNLTPNPSNPLNKNQLNLKAKINYHETMSMGGNNRGRKIGSNSIVDSKNKKITKSVKGDQWIDQLV